MTIISPSVLSADFSDLKGEIEHLNNSKAEWVHFDVMDGHFVPNITFGPDILKVFEKHCTKKLDVHIMVSNPMKVVDYFKKNNVYMMTFHIDVLFYNSTIIIIFIFNVLFTCKICDFCNISIAVISIVHSIAVCICYT